MGRFPRSVYESKVFPKKILTGLEVKEKLDKSASLVGITKPSIDRLKKYFQTHQYLIFIADSEGCLAYIDGNETLCGRAKQQYLVAGSYPEESSILAKAIGMAIIEETPITVPGESLFDRESESWNATSFPIHQGNAEVIGALVLYHTDAFVSEHTIPLIESEVQFVEERINAEAEKAKCDSQVQYSNGIISQHPVATLILNADDTVLSVNGQLALLLGENQAAFTGKPIENYMADWPALKQRLVAGQRIVDLDVEVQKVPNPDTYLISITPMLTEANSYGGAILTFSGHKQVFSLANRYVGNRASYTFNDIIGVSVPIRRTIEQARKMAQNSSPILITGEIGIGKEVFAQAIHNASERAGCGFVKIALKSIPTQEMEHELFGFEDGVFPGIKKAAQPGRYELANGGTLYIDEIQLLAAPLQQKLLEAIRTGFITRVGSKSKVRVDVRVIAANSSDLRQAVEKEGFNLDLFYCLTENPLNIPPLRERRHDVPLFIRHYLEIKAREQGKPVPVLPKQIVRILSRYVWPQNLRELEKFISIVVDRDGKIGHDTKNEREFKKKYLFLEQREAVDSIMTIEQLEQNEISKALRIMKGDMSKAARRLGVSRNTLYLKCRRYGIEF